MVRTRQTKKHEAEQKGLDEWEMSNAVIQTWIANTVVQSIGVS